MIPTNMVWETHASRTASQAKTPPPLTTNTPPKATNQTQETKPQSPYNSGGKGGDHGEALKTREDFD